MTNPDLWADVSTLDLICPDGRDLSRPLVQAGMGGRRQQQALTEYRRWLYLDRLSPGHPVPFAMGKIAGLHRGRPFDDSTCGQATDRAPLTLYAQEFGTPAPLHFWPDQEKMRRIGLLEHLALGSFAVTAIAALMSEAWVPLPDAVLGLAALPTVLSFGYRLLCAPAFMSRPGD